MKARNLKIVFSLALILFGLTTGCSSERVLTAEQRQILQSRFFSGLSYPELFQAVADVLKESGYQTTQIDAEQGVIVGTLHFNVATNFTTPFGRDSHRSIREGEHMEALFNVKAVDADNLLVRLSLQLIPEYSLGVVQGQEIQDPQSYENFFNHLQALVEKRAKLRQSQSQGQSQSQRQSQNKAPKPNQKQKLKKSAK